MSVRIRAVERGEGERLRGIAIAAKGHWGYDLDRVRQWGATGDYSDQALRQKEIYVAQVGKDAIGWAGLIPNGEVCWLDDLWVHPIWMGHGTGSRLFRHAADRAKALGASRMEWEAEPNALGFYEKMGGRYLRESEPNQWGRVLSIMGIAIER
jgi:GNAT superfamily N-acetyltransferase